MRKIVKVEIIAISPKKITLPPRDFGKDNRIDGVKHIKWGSNIQNKSNKYTEHG